MPSPPPSHPSRSHAGDRVWETACDLFYREGIRGVGVAEIVARSGVGKPSLYRNFDSKEGLVVAYITAQADADRAFWEATRAAYPNDAAAQLRHLVTTVAELMCSPGYRGCALANAAVEFPDRDHPVQVAVEAFKADRLMRLTNLATELHAPDPRQLAYMIQLLLEGAAASAQVLPAEHTASALVEAVDRVVRSCLTGPNGATTGDPSRNKE